MGCLHKQEKVIIKARYYVEVSDYDGKKFLWEVVDDYVVEEGKENYDIGLRGFYVNFLDGHKGG